MGRLRVVTATGFAVLYAVSIVHGMVTGEVGLVTATTPVASLAVAFLFGVPAIRAMRRNGEDGG